MQALINYFGIKGLIPHGYCLSWSPALLWLNVVSDLLITAAYYSIPLMLVYFIRQRKDFPYSWLATMFAGFIVACGTTHLLSVVTIWIPLYWLDGIVKAFTALISVATAALMIRVIPRALTLPSTAQLRTEIKQRQAAEEALRESEHKLSTILDSVEAFIYIKDCNFKYQYANKQVRRLFGKAQEDIVGKSDDVFFDEATTMKLREDDLHVIEQGQRIANEEINVSKDNRITHAYLSIKQPLRSEDGSIYGLCGISTDITERKQMEEKLRESNAFKNSVLNSLTSHIAVLDAQGMIVAVNNAWLKFAEENGITERSKVMLGVNYLDVCKNAFHKPYGEESQAAYSGIMAVLRGEMETFHLEYPCHSPNQQRWFLLNVSPLHGSYRGVVVNHVNITERKQAERVMIQLKAMIDVSLDGFWIVDLQGNLLQVNDAYAKISGYSIAELLKMSINDLEASEGQEQIQAHIQQVMARGYDLFETRHRHKDGHIMDIEISAGFLSEFQHFCVFCRDITQRKVLENELKASEARFRSIIEVSPVPMALLNDEQLSLTYLNSAFVKTLGYTLGDIPTLSDWWPKAYPDPDYRNWVMAAWQQAMEKSIRENTDIPPLELVIHCKNSNIKNVIISAAATSHSSNEHVVILYDITRLKQVEAKLNAIFDASVEGIITVDSDDNIVAANTAVEIIFGYKPDELIDCSVSKIIPTSPEKMSDDNLALTVKLPGKIREIEGLHKNGSLVPLDLSVAKYSIDNAHYFTYIVRDVSLRKQREQQDKAHLDELAHVTRLGLMGEMASGIAHEVNQPLCAISSYTQVSLNLLNSENPDLVKLQEILQKTKQQALRAGQIIHRMREFVKSQSKHRSRADINTLIHDAVDLCSVNLKNNDIKLTFHLENNLPPVYVDHVQIEQVIINLIRNSVEALQNLPANQQRHLSIRSRLSVNNNIQVGVKDNGAGLGEEQKKQIFTPFYTTKTDGMGMGLSISRSLIEAHDGTLNFNSEQGKGSSFYITLPSKPK